MATLVDGQEYGLTSDELESSNKTVIHFKLTDSCLKTLEDLFKKGNGSLPEIQFQGNQGVIKIPPQNTAGIRQPEQTFQLSLSAAVQGQLNDCVQQSSENGSNSMLTQGSMLQKVSVAASDDVYDRTRANMKMVEEETKKVCAKEIKPSGRHSKLKVLKKTIPQGSLRIPPPPTSKSLSMAKPSVPPSASSRPIIPPASTTTPSPRPSSITPPLPRPAARPPTPSSLSLSSSTTNTTTHKPTAPTPLKPPSSGSGNNPASRVLNPANARPTSGAINMPYRDRIIHLLALHNYKKPELMLRLQKDGIREKDKNSLGTVLNQVATMNRDNTYSLNSAGWACVKQDWSFYTDADRQLLQKNLADRCITPTSPAVSPASSNPESPGSSQKRNLDDGDDNSGPNKKKRIAHPDRRRLDVKLKAGDLPPSPTNRENVDGTQEDGDSLSPDYLSRFNAIVNREQRSKYKQEFNKEYSEYQNLHTEVDSVAKKFQVLRSKIEDTITGSTQYEALRKQVLEEYEIQRCDLKFLERKRRMEYLHQKLGHIKRLIHDFDHRGQVLSPAS